LLLSVVVAIKVLLLLKMQRRADGYDFFGLGGEKLARRTSSAKRVSERFRRAQNLIQKLTTT
jgi:hypothetical protein